MAKGELLVEGVTVNFGGLSALSDVSLRVEPGQVVGLIGPNGAGKTTLFNVICGFVRPNSGQLQFDGQLLRRHRPHSLAGLGIARTLQGVGLFSGLDVLANVMAGATARSRAGFASSLFALPRAERDERALRQRARHSLEELRIAEWADRMPAELPYAIQKRVALARALVTDPALLLLDEPASGLSETEMEEMGVLVRGLRERMSVLLVEHHMDLVMSVCDQIVVLDFGQVIATGPPAEIKANPEVTRAYLGEDVTDVSADDLRIGETVPEGSGDARD